MSVWTDDLIEELTALWKEGRLSAASIAQRMGVSRNAIIGKVNRLGLSVPQVASSKAKRKRGQFKMPETSTPIVIEPKPEDAKTAFGTPVALLDLTDATCRFPIGDVAPYMFCGAEPEKGKPYCKAHCACAFRPSYYAPRAA